MADNVDIVQLKRSQYALDRASIVLASLTLLSLIPCPSKPTKADLLSSLYDLQLISFFMSFITYLLLRWINGKPEERYKWRLIILPLSKTLNFVLFAKKNPEHVDARLNVKPLRTFVSTFFAEPANIILGAKLAALTLHNYFLPLPLSQHFLVQFISFWSIYFTGDNGVVCQGELLSSDVYERRVLKVSQLLESIPLTFGSGPVSIPEDPVQRCVSLITFSQIMLGAIIPALILMKVAPPAIIISSYENKVDRWIMTRLAWLSRPSRKLNLDWEKVPCAPQQGQGRRQGRWNPVVVSALLWWCLISIIWRVSIKISAL